MGIFGNVCHRYLQRTQRSCHQKKGRPRRSDTRAAARQHETGLPVTDEPGTRGGEGIFARPPAHRKDRQHGCITRSAQKRVAAATCRQRQRNYTGTRRRSAGPGRPPPAAAAACAPWLRESLQTCPAGRAHGLARTAAARGPPPGASRHFGSQHQRGCPRLSPAEPRRPAPLTGPSRGLAQQGR